MGRDYETITRSTNLNTFILEDGADPEKATAKARGKTGFEDYSRGTFVATAGQLVERIEKLIEAGANYINTYFPRIAYDHSMLTRFAEEVMPRFK